MESDVERLRMKFIKFCSMLTGLDGEGIGENRLRRQPAPCQLTGSGRAERSLFVRSRPYRLFLTAGKNPFFLEQGQFCQRARFLLAQ